ncbi:retropepsin-like aspartic protease [Sphingomonas sp. HITSZ_GF]|uniref:retropepsin-like aspartic protease n=1 Tax=Sphingomonas sp. HITSZ_GF TaxID=3037247 RepID=UPI00240D1B66|nr:retropepsin-like aspartic protease [Sphingomonas sp. HITSZ_GF]MDG2535406.1 retropepsin-like aspartic protease [Sphingomonas sp. HITSZ_GF]
MLRTLLPALALLLGAAPAPGLRSFPIERPATLAGRPTGGQLPIVHATVAGRPGIFLFDTGANQTVLSPDFADAAGLTQRTAIAGRDSSGAQITANPVEMVRQVDLAIGEARYRLARAVVTRMTMLDSLGIDGVVSAQSLVGPDCLRIDFAKGVATSAPPASPVCTLDGVAVPVGPDDMARATVTAGGASGPFLLDSGAWRTSLPANLLPDAPRLGGERHGGVSGVARTSDLIGPVTLNLGGRDLRLAQARRAPPGKGGVIGFDLLSSAILVLRPGQPALLALP